MKKLPTLLLVFLMGIGMSYANVTEEDRFRGNNNNFIFTEGGIEFAIFPDGQFDFNFLNAGPQFSAGFHNSNVNVSFNTGFNYDPFVQYDSYGAVIQIENTPIFYDGYGRIIQAGNIFINYRNGYVNRIGNLNVFYNRPGVIFRTTGFINSFNRYYVYQPWHRFYGVPLANHCIVWNNPYRLNYNPFRFGWDYHRVHWNRPNYYNGRFLRANVRRNFYRPSDRVNYRSFERGRRDSNGRAIATRAARRDRNAIATGHRTLSRNDSRVTTSRRSDNNVNSRSTRRNTVATQRTTRAPRAVSNTRTSRNRNNSATTSSSNRNITPAISNRANTRRTAPAVSNSRTSRRSTATTAPSRSRSNSRAISTSSKSRNTSVSIKRSKSSRSAKRR
ncbi:hypothetical protein [Nonlabens sp.]|uniref:hypothetical protein n=1 Tax=Nonlabens sp. TaxID=1888209 RepID=UPI003F69DFDE